MLSIVMFILGLVMTIHSNTPIQHDGIVNDAKFSPDGKHITTVGNDKTAIIWNTETCQPTQELQGHNDKVVDVDYSSDGRWIATASWDKTVKIWNASTGQLLHTLQKHSKALNNLAFSYDSKLLLTVGKDNQVNFWDTRTFDIIDTIHFINGDVSYAEFNPDGDYVVFATYNIAGVHNISTWEIEYKLEHPNNLIRIATYSPDGKFIATIGYGTSVAAIWDAETGELLHEIEGAGDHVGSITYSPDGQWIATTYNTNPINRDFETNIYNAKTGDFIQRLYGHIEDVTNASFSPGGKYIVTTSFDSTAIIWDIETWEMKCSLGIPKYFEDDLNNS